MQTSGALLDKVYNNLIAENHSDLRFTLNIYLLLWYSSKVCSASISIMHVSAGNKATWFASASWLSQ